MSKYFVYCLYSGEALQYVGSTTDPIKRLKQHRADKLFDSVRYVKVSSKEEMLNLEGYCISNFKPVLNIAKPTYTEVDIKNYGWKIANLDFLRNFPTDNSFDEFCIEEYHEYRAKILGIPSNVLYNLEQVSSNYSINSRYWNYDIVNNCLVIKHDMSGKSLEELVIERGGVGFDTFRERLSKINDIVTCEAYYKSLEQFD